MWNINDRYHDEDVGIDEGDTAHLKDLIGAAYRSCLLICDREALERLGNNLVLGWREDEADFFALKHYEDEPAFAYVESIQYLASWLKVVAALHQPSNATLSKIEIARQIALNGAHLLHLDDKKANKEADVHAALTKYLTVAFPSTRNHPPIVQNTKTYKPDIGIDELQYAIEVKYAKTRAQAVVCVAGIYEDMMGYAGDPAWRRFLGVIYATTAAVTQAHIDAEVKRLDVPEA